MKRLHQFILAAVGAMAMASAFAGPVNINTADAKTLSEELTGIGLARAQAIVEYRQANGPFKNAEDLLNVKGVGARTLEMNRENILVADARGSGK